MDYRPVRSVRRGQAGYTLIEIMVVVFIIGLLAALAGTKVLSMRDKAMHQAAKTQVETLAQSVRMFNLDNGRYPSSAEGLAALIPPPPANLPNYNPDGYLEKSVPIDPWGKPYDYQLEGRSFAVISYGADGLPGGDGFDADLDSRTL